MDNLLKKYACHFNKQKGRKYPFSNQVIKCVYITEHKQEVIDYLNKNNLSITKMQKNVIEWQEGNEFWRWHPISKAFRGYRFYKVKISKNYNNYKVLKTIILPCCVNYCCSWEIME